MLLTRRDLGKFALAAVPASRLFAAKPNSKWGGVQVGLNVPYSFHDMAMSGDDILKNLLQLGLNAVELRSQPVEAFLGAPVIPAGGGRNRPLTPEQDAARKKAMADLEKWRLSLSMDRVKTFRKKYEDAGVPIDIVKFDAVDSMKDDVVDYAFNLAKALGARYISCEIPLSKTKWLGEFATKHKMMVGYHGHTNITSPEAFAKPESWETAMSHSKYNGCNIDIGHFVAANNYSPADFLRKYHDRITHIHIKDRKKNQGPNVPFGQGDTPIKEILQMMKKEKYGFQATIEFEYPVPAGSDTMTEIGKCVQYCKEALV
jgi:sugar phosphate isomerase/epimerase